MKTLVTLLVFLLGSMNLVAQNTIIAHRGASYIAPENTLAAVKLAWEQGADAVEVDVHLTKDNRVLVIHDKTTRRTCNGKKNLTIAKTPSILLRDQDAGIWKGNEWKGEKLPFLSEVIATIPEGKNLVVEIKCGAEILPALERIVEESGKAEQIVFISFDWNTILKTREAFPANKCYWLSTSKAGLDQKMQEAATQKLTGVNLKNSIIDAALIEKAKSLELDVVSWTIDDPAEAKRLIDLGVSGITTNRPKWLKEELGKL